MHSLRDRSSTKIYTSHPICLHNYPIVVDHDVFKITNNYPLPRIGVYHTAWTYFDIWNNMYSNRWLEEGGGMSMYDVVSPRSSMWIIQSNSPRSLYDAITNCVKPCMSLDHMSNEICDNIIVIHLSNKEHGWHVHMSYKPVIDHYLDQFNKFVVLFHVHCSHVIS